MKEFDKLVNIVKTLRGENGCEWDKKQTLESMKRYILEEIYELIESINKNDINEIKEEIGDILMHMVFLSRIAEENGWFDIKDALNTINNKLIYRHPHVFGDKKVDSVEDILKNWEELKKQQKKEREYILDGIPNAMPPLRRSIKIQEKISRLGIDFKDIYSIINKIDEELNEVKESFKQGNKDSIKGEIGDLFFVLTRLALYLEIDPEDAIEKTNIKVIKRFKYIEDKLKKENKDITEAGFEELNKIWEESK
ncbi:MAG TPA: nucleoside triphosphate pyrophosphohydrolase [Spirochaetota bacterium]|nr:nucleoside triphosphate pyrophosphohydrolase [Spirochaetota bacterium]HOM38294.1 nucleoside triphosphate pyrophosphohydrolase [Spirochaetota bacterium]HPQ48488.1 nucleoside triphosphate pyrophosphohydrolase [Spirochaetota bacterium]